MLIIVLAFVVCAVVQSIPPLPKRKYKKTLRRAEKLFIAHGRITSDMLRSKMGIFALKSPILR